MPSEQQVDAAQKVFLDARPYMGSRELATLMLTASEQAEPAPASRSGAVKVKPLEWKDERNCECSAETVIGTYEVGFDDGWWAQLEGGVKWDWDPPYDPRSYEGPSAAKAAAQADYERRILAALEPSEPATDVEPFTYFYRYSDPMSGKAVWRSSGGLWNGQRPSETLPLYTRPPEPAADAEPVATVYRKGNVTGQLVWTKVGERADLPDGTNLYTHPPESRLREALEEIADLKTVRDRPDDYNRGFADGRWQAVKIARAALAQEDGR